MQASKFKSIKNLAMNILFGFWCCMQASTARHPCGVQLTQLADPQMPSMPRLHKLVPRLLLFAHNSVQSLLLQTRQVVKPQNARKEKKRKDYAFRRQFNEKPSVIPGCSGPECHMQSPDELPAGLLPSSGLLRSAEE
jgi:hypothetical protein